MQRLLLELSDGARRAVTEADMQMDDLEKFTLEELRTTFSFTLKDAVVYRRLAHHHKRARETEDRIQPAATPIAAEVHTAPQLTMSAAHATGKVVPLSPENAMVERLQRYTGAYQPAIAGPGPRSYWMTVVIKTLTGMATELRVHRNDTVEHVKELLNAKDGIPPDQQRFISGGKLMEDKRTLVDYNISDKSVIHFVLRLSGG